MSWSIWFMLLLLKIPVIYLCAVIYWAIRKTPQPLEPARVLAALDDGTPPAGRGRGPHRCQGKPRPRRPSPSQRIVSRPRSATLARR